MIVKVCGMRDLENIQKVDQLSVDWLGFIFYDKSPRYVSKRLDLTAISAKKVGVFVNATLDEISNRIEQFTLDMVQLHGDETPSFCGSVQALGCKVMKAFGMDVHFDFSQLRSYEEVVDYFLFDTKGLQRGGNGHAFDWSILNRYSGTIPFMLSGGISPLSIDDLAQFEHDKWIGIDLNSRFEITPGLKDVEKLSNFIEDFKQLT